ncbi:urease accessory protein UreE [Myroides marinus]|uniref:urease accessory protein UreE n=1 Tax=Myroides marinus TaxID=703342 RepID=UPI002576DBC6|nr:urease accessory protein UreE [Myroides marinus]MDM1383648.1 urease accessory protein UreE [Myroides marinus]
MVVTQAIRNSTAQEVEQHIDYLYIEWYQTSKRIQRLVTADGEDIAIRFLGKGQDLKHGDILYEDLHKVVMVSILACEAIAFTTTDLSVLSLVAYEVGNKHTPLFAEGNSVFMPYERAMYDWFLKNGYKAEIVQKQLCNPLNANVDFNQHKKFTFTPPKGGLSLKL